LRLQYPAIALALSALMLAGIAVVSWQSVHQLAAGAEGVEHTHRVLAEIDQVQRLVSDARRGEGGFLLTGDASRLQTVYTARLQLNDTLASLAALTADNRAQRNRVEQLNALVDADLASIDRAVALHRTNEDAAAAEYESPATQSRFAQITHLLDDARREEQRLLDARTGGVATRVRWTLLIVGFGYALALALGIGAMLRMRREIVQRLRAEDEVERTNRELTTHVSELQTRSQQLTLLGHIGELLQACRTLEEAAELLSNSAPEMFSFARGGLFRVAPSRNVAAPLASWPDAAEPFAPSDCWAIRRGAPHESTTNVTCGHLERSKAAHAFCVPLVAQGDMLGVLTLEWDDDHDPRELARAAAEQIALALANLELQQTLRMHAIRDPLTSLFNRRYMEESLNRELHRAARSKTPLSVMMFDLDRFKEFNDLFGHAAGDNLLRDLGRNIAHEVRVEDIACRYGGDEFVVILPGAPPECAIARAELLIEKTRRMPIAAMPDGGTVTMSVGVASFPADAHEPETLLGAADRALYGAKRAGRARVARVS